MKLVFLSFFLMFSCNGVLGLQSENEKFIQGKWILAGNLGDQSENRTWLLEWEFNDGKFIQSGYPPIIQKGKYKIIESDKNILKLKLYDQKGTFGSDDGELNIIFNKRENILTIGGKKGFKRMKPKK